MPYTLNGFPYGDFHQEVVKHRVYEPTWWQPERLHYTMQLVEIHRHDPAGGNGREHLDAADRLGDAVPRSRASWSRPRLQLRQAAAWLHQLEEETGRLIYLCLEPEPGCVFSFADDVVHFFQWQLFDGEDDDIVRRHIRICHDICHAAVMFEDQEEVLRKYAAAGIHVGKVQVSAALRMDLDLFEPPAADARAAAVKQLAQFAEDRYLHQTVVRRGERGRFLRRPAARARSRVATIRAASGGSTSTCRSTCKEFGRLRSTQEQIAQCLAAAREHSTCQHYEVETYAWGVLPAELKQPELAAGIAEELRWFERAELERSRIRQLFTGLKRPVVNNSGGVLAVCLGILRITRD